MSSTNKPTTFETADEAEKLRALWASNESGRLPQAQFGEVYDIGGQSAVANFLNGRSPLSMKAAIGFARGLGVPIEDFSPRLAAEARRIAAVVNDLDRTLDEDIRMGRRLQPASSPALLGEIRRTAQGTLERHLYDYSGGRNFPSVDILVRDPDAAAFRIRGDVCYPRYRAGEFVITSSSAERLQGTDVIVQIDLGPLLLMQWNWERDGDVQLLPIRGDSGPMTIPLTDISWSERVLAVTGPDFLLR